MKEIFSVIWKLTIVIMKTQAVIEKQGVHVFKIYIEWKFCIGIPFFPQELTREVSRDILVNFAVLQIFLGSRVLIVILDLSNEK